MFPLFYRSKVISYHLIKILITFALLAILLEACNTNSPSLEPTIIPVAATTSTATITNTPKPTQITPTLVTETPTASASPTSLPSLTGSIYFDLDVRYLNMIDLASGKMTTILYKGLLLDPVISSTGKIYFLLKETQDTYNLYNCDLDGGNIQLIASSPYGIGEIAVSGDGNRIAFLTFRDDHADLSVLYLGEDGVEGSIYSALIFGGISWSNSGKRLAFFVDREMDQYGGKSNLYIADYNGLNRIQIKSSFPMADDVPAWSPDDQKIAVAMKDGPVDNLYLIDVNTQEMTKLTDAHANVRKPIWSPAGNRILFWLGTSIATISADGTDMKVLADTRSFYEYQFGRAAWSPDGQYIVYEYRPNTTATPTLYVVNAMGGTPVQLGPEHAFSYGDGIASLSWINK